MITIEARNVNDGLSNCLIELHRRGKRRDSRNGPVLAFMEPVATVHRLPTRRVLTSPVRNANPTFHLLESLWMLAGRSDVRFPSIIVKNMKSFTDDGVSYWGAYGRRWRRWFGHDQLELIVKELRDSPDSRRAVLGMWDPGTDLPKALQAGKDVPCNTHIYFDRRGGKLNMTVCCRSNDILWGCYGANAVHMSVLQEYMALWLDVPVGVYTQISNDLHLYESALPTGSIGAMVDDLLKNDAYRLGRVEPTSLLAEGEFIQDFDTDIERFFSHFDTLGLDGIANVPYNTEFFSRTVAPMVFSWIVRDSNEAMKYADMIQASDWSYAMKQWLNTRSKK